MTTLHKQGQVPIIAETSGPGQLVSDHLYRAGAPRKQPIPEESLAPAQYILPKFQAPMCLWILTSMNPTTLRQMLSS